MSGLAHDARGGISNPVLGMLLFITSEVMFFSGLFAAYFNVRANASQWPPEEFQHTLQILPLVGPATILLILSSFTCQFGVWAIRRGDRVAFIRNFAVTVVIGVVFLVMQVTDYTVLGSEGLTLSSGTFGTTYYTPDRLPRRARLRRRHHAERRALSRAGRPVLAEASRRGRGGVAVLALRRRRLDPALLAHLPAARQPAARRLGGPTVVHPLRHPRNSVFVGLAFVVIAVIYWAVPTIGGWHVDYAGVTMLIALGVAMALMAYVLIAGSHE